ncbi:MAG: DUF2442 domain-containing protein [Burkholderiales bacterium]|nr:DUF2442 domain-containing protein [Burkholderiales bacterium]
MATDTTRRDRADEAVGRAVDEHLASAVAASRARRTRGELAASVTYDARTARLRIELVCGVGVSIPVAKIEDLADVPASVIRTVRMQAGGYGLYWPSLDLDIAVPELVAGCFGSRTWMSALARQGGKVSSPAKRRAARANGKLGGRPRKARAGR